ncbi:MAG TPA: ABC transporter permease [Deinococcales bacterium]|nr:ABC transporter permease [Deinococcales bacterium]
MTSYLTRRLLGLIPVLFGISLLIFSFVRLIPGDPATVMMGERGTPEDIARVRAQLGLDRPLFFDVPGMISDGPAQLFNSQYFIFLSNTARGDLGQSIFSRVPISRELSARFPATIELATAAMIFAITFGGLIGVIAAVRRNTIVDNAAMMVALVGVSMPIFWLGILLIYLFAVNLGWLPASGRLSVMGTSSFQPVTGLFVLDSLLRLDFRTFADALSHLILPAIALGTIPLAVIARMTRASMIEVLSQDYVRTARAKGLSERLVVFKHALRNAMLPVTTVVGLSFGTLLGGAVLTETIFSWPGIGSWIVEGIFQRDYPIVQGGVILVAGVFVFVNLLVDLLYSLLDPRIQYR